MTTQTRTITIDPVTRIEGHAKITIQLSPSGEVQDARFHVTQFRGFEKFCEGRPFDEMPSLMARICGICPVSHLLAAAKACDAVLAVKIPEAAARLRRIMNLGQILQSHALSLFHLSSPDLLLGMDADPETRHVFGIDPEIARDGIRLRSIGQQVIETLGGKRIHPAWAVPGGVNHPLTAQARERMVAMLPEGLEIVDRTLARFRGLLGEFPEEADCFANFPSLYMGLRTPEGHLEHYDGELTIAGADGQILHHDADFRELIEEQTEPDSYLRSPYYKPLGYPNGIYRVGPLPRLNLANVCGTPKADVELASFRAGHSGPITSSFAYHHARLIEMLYCLERIGQLLDHPEILDSHVRAVASPNAGEGVGVSEAPRGTLMHHYKVDRHGLVQWSNLIIATGHNNLAMNRGVAQVARRFVHGDRLTEGALNRVEAVIRAFDPCLSCSTHAFGEMPLEVSLVDCEGKLLDRKQRLQ